MGSGSKLHPLPSLNLLHAYYTQRTSNRRVLELCGATEPETPYTQQRQSDLTVILNAWARPDYLPLIWEAVQYQTCRPYQTWIVQNNPGLRSQLPGDFLRQARQQPGTLVLDSDLNHGCWFRFLLAAMHCRTPYVAFLDDDTLPARRAMETALAELRRKPGVYGGRGIILNSRPQGPNFWDYQHFGWPVGTPETTQVDFVGHFWMLETHWLRELSRYLPAHFWECVDPSQACGEDMFVSFVAQKLGLDTFVYPHGANCNERWSSIQAYEMGMHPNAMNVCGGLDQAPLLLEEFRRQGWRLLRHP